MHQGTRQKVSKAIQAHGAAAVARALGTSRNAVLSYAAGTSREGTSFMIEAREERLDTLEVAHARR